jgi:redox-sensitive bicupin YhaK (pirin superfamily)
MLLEPREVPLGGPRAMLVRRTLPHKAIRTIGAFCFVDHYGPNRGEPMVVPPHPHTGLQTVSWLLSGTIDHRDSVGSVQRIHPGELNLMTAGAGIAHSEYSAGDDALHGVQLWVALPEGARHQTPHFEHHADLPTTVRDGLEVRVVMGDLLGLRSPAATYSPLVCAELRLRPGRHRLPVESGFEHGLLLVDGDLVVDGTTVARTALLHRPPGIDALDLTSSGGATALLIGGEPLAEDLLMWWNFVARTHEEIVAARDAWASGRFAPVVDDARDPLPAPDLPGVRLKPRPNRPARPEGVADSIPPGVF